jgi:hypothetical protein
MAPSVLGRCAFALQSNMHKSEDHTTASKAAQRHQKMIEPSALPVGGGGLNGAAPVAAFDCAGGAASSNQYTIFRTNQAHARAAATYAEARYVPAFGGGPGGGPFGGLLMTCGSTQ